MAQNPLDMINSAQGMKGNLEMLADGLTRTKDPKPEKTSIMPVVTAAGEFRRIADKESYNYTANASSDAGNVVVSVTKDGKTTSIKIDGDRDGKYETELTANLDGTASAKANGRKVAISDPNMATAIAQAGSAAVGLVNGKVEGKPVLDGAEANDLAGKALAIVAQAAKGKGGRS